MSENRRRFGENIWLCFSEELIYKREKIVEIRKRKIRLRHIFLKFFFSNVWKKTKESKIQEQKNQKEKEIEIYIYIKEVVP